MIAYGIVVEERVWLDAEAVVSRISRDNPDAATKWFRSLVKKMEDYDRCRIGTRLLPKRMNSAKKFARRSSENGKINTESCSRSAAIMYTFFTFAMARANRCVRDRNPRNNASDQRSARWWDRIAGAAESQRTKGWQASVHLAPYSSPGRVAEPC